MPRKSLPGCTMATVELTSRCNLACPMCPHSILTRAKADMDFGLFVHIVNRSREERVPISWLHHIGEPLMYPRIREALAYFSKFGFGPGSISTNATLLTEESVKMLAEYGRKVLVSVDTGDAAVYAKMRGGNLESVRRKVQSLIDGSDCEIEIQHLHTSEDKGADVGGMFKTRSGVSVIHKPAVRWAGTEDFTREDMRCFRFSHLIVAQDGRATMCCMDHDIRQPIGNIGLETFYGLWMSAEAIRQRRTDKRSLPACSACIAAGCKGAFPGG